MDLTLREWLAQGRRLIADGATGTMIMSAGLPAGAPPELWNAEQPDKIVALHTAYLEAGSQIILSNTFGGSRLKLEKTGLSERTRELNLCAAELALKAAGDSAFVAGDIGPTGELMAPMGVLTYDLALNAFAEQAAALAEGGVQAIWVETMTDLEEARAAVNAALQATTLPVFCSLSFGRRAKTIMGVSGKKAAETLWPLGLTALGLNCGEGLEMVPEVLSQMRAAAPDAVLIAKPNAGMPRLSAGQTVYDLSPQDFALRMENFVEQGAQIVGSCCGSSPAFIKALSEKLH